MPCMKYITYIPCNNISNFVSFRFSKHTQERVLPAGLRLTHENWRQVSSRQKIGNQNTTTCKETGCQCLANSIQFGPHQNHHNIPPQHTAFRTFIRTTSYKIIQHHTTNTSNTTSTQQNSKQQTSLSVLSGHVFSTPQ